MAVCGPDGGCERSDRVLEIEGLAAQEHDVEFLGELIGLHRGRIFQRHVAVRAFDHEAGARQLRGALRANQKGYVATGLQQPAAEISADRTGADHENAHGLVPFVVGFEEREWRVANREWN